MLAGQIGEIILQGTQPSSRGVCGRASQTAYVELPGSFFLVAVTSYWKMKAGSLTQILILENPPCRALQHWLDTLQAVMNFVHRSRTHLAAPNESGQNQLQGCVGFGSLTIDSVLGRVVTCDLCLCRLAWVTQMWKLAHSRDLSVGSLSVGWIAALSE